MARRFGGGRRLVRLPRQNSVLSHERVGQLWLVQVCEARFRRQHEPLNQEVPECALELYFLYARSQSSAYLLCVRCVAR